MRIDMSKLKGVLGFVGFIVCLTLANGQGAAQTGNFPDRPVHLIVPFAPGGSTDTLARLLSTELSRMWGKPIVVENRGGSLGQMAMTSALAMPPDGYNLVISTSGTYNMNPWLFTNLNYDPTRTTHIVKLIDVPYALFVAPQTPVNSMKEFLAWAQSRQSPPTYGYAGASYEVIIRDLSKITGIKALGVPFKAEAQAITELLAGRLDFLVDANYVVQPFADAKQVKVLMVTSNERSPLLPNVPTMTEVGLPEFKPTVWVGVAGPVGMPSDLTKKIADDVEVAMNSPAIRERVEPMGMDVRILKGDALNDFVRAQTSIWGEAIKAANIEPQ
jgi:tripartite-type tricarboxylate transporter receptor subunit TctC